MSKILLLGDIHLGAGQSIGKAGIGTALNSRVLDQVKILDWVLDQAIEKNISHIVLTGDIFEDPKPHYNLVLIFLDWLKQCVGHDIEVHIICGNHDLLRNGQFNQSILDIVSASHLEKVFIHKKINTLHLDKISITVLPFRDRRSFNTQVNSEAIKLLAQQLPFELSGIKLEDTKIVIGHLALENSIPIGYEIDDLQNELMCPFSIFEGYDFVWMGHIHKFQVLSQTPYCAHIGSMDISNFGERDQKKFIAIIDPLSDNKFEYIEIPTRPIIQINIEVPNKINELSSYINDQLSRYNVKNAIVRVNISLDSTQAVHINRVVIEKKLYDMGAFHIFRIAEEKRITQIKTKITKEVASSLDEISAIKTYASSIDDDIKDKFINLAISIINEYKEGNKN